MPRDAVDFHVVLRRRSNSVPDVEFEFNASDYFDSEGYFWLQLFRDNIGSKLRRFVSMKSK
jgi:hypothetical protein